MATYYLGDNGKLRHRTSEDVKKEQKKKKKGKTYTLGDNGTLVEQVEPEKDIAPVATKKEEKSGLLDGWFKKSGGNIAETIIGSGSDILQSFTEGIVGAPEDIMDFLAPLSSGAYASQKIQAGGMLTQEDFDTMKEIDKHTTNFVKKDLYDREEIARNIIGGLSAGANASQKVQSGGTLTTEDFELGQEIKKATEDYLKNDMEKNSVFDDKSDSLVSSLAQMVLTRGMAKLGVPWQATTFMTSGGAEMEEALKSGATQSEAITSALITGAANVGAEYLGGGISFGSSTLDDMLVNPFINNIKSKALRTGAKITSEMIGEGLEEVVTEFVSNAGTKAYREEDLKELLFGKEAGQEYLDAFISGGAMGGLASGTKAFQSAKSGIDYATENTANEQKVIDAETQSRVEAAEEKKGKKLTYGEKAKIREQVQADMEKGYISTDTLESVLGGETYETYKSAIDKENALREEMANLQNDPKASSQKRLAEAKAELTALEKGTEKTLLKEQLSKEVQEITKNERLYESYNENVRKTQKFEADLSQYDEKTGEIIRKAAESGILNNTNRTHDFVDWIAKMSAEKGVSFDFANNESLKNSGFAIDGKTINGLVHNGDVILNVDSQKALNTVVGHEITHILEGSPELYNDLQNKIMEYSKLKGDYEARYEALTKLYKDIKDADINAELTADLVGDYLFTDETFIRNLSAEKPNIFKKVFEEIKYLCKVATAGSKEARELEKVKRAFEKVHKEKQEISVKEDGHEDEDIRYSLGKQTALMGTYNVYGKDIALETTRNNSKDDFANAGKMADDYAPVREDVARKTGERATIAEQSLKAITRKVKRELGLGVAKGRELMQIIKEYGENTDLITEKDLYDVIKSNFDTRTESVRVDDVADAQAYLRKTKLSVSDSVKSGIDKFNDLRKANFGKIRFSKDGLAVDEMYGELSGLYPYLFPSDVVNQAEQLDIIVDVANMSREIINKIKVDEPTLRRATDIIIEEIRHYTNAQNDDVIQRRVAQTQEKLDETLRLRETMHNSLDRQLADLQAKYEQTQDASLVQRIADIKRDRDIVDEEYNNKIESLNEQIAKYNSPIYKTAQQRKVTQSEYEEQMKQLVGDTSTWKDKKLGISYRVNTLKRNLRDIVRDASGKQDIAKADAIYNELQGKYNHNEALLKKESKRIKDDYAKLKITKEEDAYIQMLGEFRHNPDTTLTEDVVKEYYKKHKRKIDSAKVDRVIEDARKTYDELLLRVNEVLKMQGMKEIPYRQGYFPHFTDEKQGIIAKLLNWKTINTEIPTDIAGLTEMFNPNRSWQSFNKQRNGDETDYSFQKGLDAYVHGALDWIYHIEDIQKRRAFENHIRYIHSEQGIKDRIEAIQSSDEYDADEVQEQIDLVYKEAGNPLNNFVTDLRAGTNALANKKSALDRGVEEFTNRKFYSVMTNLSNRTTANMVGGSVSSALTNFIPITQSWGEVSPLSSLRAMGDTIRSTFRDDGTIAKSDFLTNRLMPEENLYKTGWDKFSDKLGILMDSIDSFTSQTVWRSKYLENISNGMSESKAVANADQFAENVMAGRSRGNMPTVFESKNPLIKTLTAFQLEVNNQYGYMFKDMPQDMKDKSAAKLVKGYATMFLGAYVYNALYSSLTGRDAAFDPIGIVEDLLRDLGLFGDDEEEEPIDIVMNLIDSILDEVPFVGGILGGGRIPISSALPYGGLYEGLSGTLEDISDENWSNLTKEWLNPIWYLALPVGGGQLKKTSQGLSMFNDEHPISGSYTNSGNLRFPVEDTPLNRAQAGLFGQWASKNASDYFDGDIAPLKEKQIQEYIDLDLPIRDYWDYREGLSEQKTLEDKFEYISDLDVSVEQKNIMINNIVDRKEKVDMSNYDDFADFEEFDFYTKNTEKYNFLQKHNVSYAEYTSNDEAKKEYDSIYSWYKNNPEKVTVSKAVTDDVIQYRRYMRDLDDIRADKDSDGKTISGSAKEKKTDYINSLDLDYGQRIILYRSLFSSNADKEAYNVDIVNYLNSREDLTYDEIVTILEELDMKVQEDGSVTW